jgi:cell division protein YceG involved in septum cleavage
MKSYNVTFRSNVTESRSANAIIRQPLGRGQSDFWAWEKERFGTYTVKTAYKLLHAAKINEREALLPAKFLR